MQIRRYVNKKITRILRHPSSGGTDEIAYENVGNPLRKAKGAELSFFLYLCPMIFYPKQLKNKKLSNL